MEKRADCKPAGKTILIVDDEFGILEVLEYILADAGYSVVSALNGQDALARLRESAPDLIMMDYMMPVMDGAALLKALRAEEKYKSIPVVLSSALPESSIRQYCDGYDAFLRKPYKTETLIDTISRLIGPTA
jgi:CheY-like chemotaxis protein